MKFLLPWLVASFLYPIPYPKESRAPEPVIVPKVCRIVNEYGHPLGSTVYLARINCAFYFLTNRHVAVYDHPAHSLYVEISGGRKVEFNYLWNFNEMAVGICFFPENTRTCEMTLVERDLLSAPDQWVFVEGYPGGEYRRGVGIVSRYGNCAVPCAVGMVNEYSMYVYLVNGGVSGGFSGGGVFYGEKLAALAWAGIDQNQLPPYVFEEIAGIPASVIKERLMLIKEILPPDFVSKTFGDKEPVAK